jgi:hypothetical protein
MRHDERVKLSGSLGDFRSRERNGAFGLAAPAGERVGERTEQKAEWSGGFGNSQGSDPQGERKSAGFQGVVFQGELKDPQSCAKGGTRSEQLRRKRRNDS